MIVRIFMRVEFLKIFFLIGIRVTNFECLKTFCNEDFRNSDKIQMYLE